MVNLNSWSNALQGAQENQVVGLAEGPKQKGDVKTGTLGGRTVTLVPIEKGDVHQNAQIRETLFQSLQNGVGQTETEKQFIQRTREQLGLDAKGKAQGDTSLKALDAREIVNVGRAQDKNTTAMLGRAMDAIIDRVPKNALSALKATILDQANHPDVVAFLDKYGSGGRDLKLLQRVCDLVIQTNRGDRMAQAYLRGFRGAERATADPLQGMDAETKIEQDAAAHRDTQIESDKKAAQENGEVIKGKNDSAIQKKADENLAKKEISTGDKVEELKSFVDGKSAERKVAETSNAEAVKKATKGSQAGGVDTVNVLGKKLSLQNNSGLGNNCFFFSVLHNCDQKTDEMTHENALKLRKNFNAYVMELMDDLSEKALGGLSYDCAEKEGGVGHFNAKNASGVGGIIDDAINEHVSGTILKDGEPVDVGNAALLADFLKQPVILYSVVNGKPQMQTFDCDLRTGEKFDSKEPPIQLYFSGRSDSNGSKATGHYQSVTKVEIDATWKDPTVVSHPLLDKLSFASDDVKAKVAQKMTNVLNAVYCGEDKDRVAFNDLVAKIENKFGAKALNDIQKALTMSDGKVTGFDDDKMSAFFKDMLRQAQDTKLPGYDKADAEALAKATTYKSGNSALK